MAMSGSTRDQRRAAARAQREATERQAAQKAQRKRRLTQLLGVLAAAAVIVVAVVLVVGHGGGATAQPTRQAGDALNGQTAIDQRLAGIPQKGITLGAADAPITVVEFGDLQCPACAAFSNQLAASIVDGYVRPGQVKMQLRDIHFLGPDSERLARLASAAGEQGKLWNVAELVWANQGQENSGYATDAYLRQIAAAVPGLDATKTLAARDSAAVTRQLAAAKTLAGAEGVDSTPTFLVGRTGGTLKKVDAQGLVSELERLAGAPAAAQQ
jgi:protein-disulfide isomerase